jgi:hypothetical protein
MLDHLTGPLLLKAPQPNHLAIPTVTQTTIP